MGILAAWIFAAAPVAARADFLFYTTVGANSPNRSITQVRRANLDGTGVQTVLTNTDGLGFGGLDLDPLKERIFTGDRTPGSIVRSGFDGSGRTNLVSNGGAGVTDVQLDLANGKVYWESGVGGAGAIYRANLDGSNQQTLVTGLNLTEGLALDVTGGKMYFTENGGGFDRIGVANLDGTGRGVFRTLTTGSSPFDVEIDPVNRTLYWNEYAGANFANQAIRRASLDTISGFETIFRPTSDQNLLSNGIDFDPLDQMLYFSYGRASTPYFTNFGPANIGRINADGSGFQNVLTDLDGINYVRVVHTSAVPEPSGLVLLSLGTLGTLGLVWRHRVARTER